MMNHSPLAAADYAKRLADPKVETPLSPLRLTIRGKSGHVHQFNTYRYIPQMFSTVERHFFSPCGRFTVYQTAPNQYAVYFNGNRVPDDRFGIRLSIRDSHARTASAYKRTRGRDADAENLPGYRVA